MPKQVLNRDDILKTAIELLDTDGLDQLSLRKLGARLGSGATSLYWHVKNKEQLISLVTDEALGEIELPDLAKITWRRAAEGFARGFHTVLVNHPWLSAAMQRDTSMGPNAARMSDHLLAILELGGFTGQESDHAGGALIWYLTGVSSSDAADREFLRKYGAGAQQILMELSVAQRSVVEPYPRLLERYEAGLAQLQDPKADLDTDSDEAFEYGLKVVLDGLESRRRQLRAHRRP